MGPEWFGACTEDNRNQAKLWVNMSAPSDPRKLQGMRAAKKSDLDRQPPDAVEGVDVVSNKAHWGHPTIQLFGGACCFL